jgi:hypothetical protein
MEPPPGVAAGAGGRRRLEPAGASAMNNGFAADVP